MKNNSEFLRNSIFILLSIVFVASCNNEKNTELTNKNKSTMEKTETGHITLINSFEVPTGKLDESIKYWEACRDFLKTQPGYISTKLHQSIKGDARFMLVNVAMWETPKAFMDATNKMRKELGVSPPEGLKPNASLYNVIRE